MYANEPADLINTEIITCILSIPLNIRTILNTLKTLIIFKLFKDSLPSPYASNIISKIEIVTMPPSSQFILSPMYFLIPIPKSFMIISIIKIHVKY